MKIMRINSIDHLKIICQASCPDCSFKLKKDQGNEKDKANSSTRNRPTSDKFHELSDDFAVLIFKIQEVYKVKYPC